ncbi:hypothetical protein [Bradyrhizobium tunisiense]|uniref:hypothetical protein n=1 Tax=Bradyrhizobium tunisiense TaxID=3278709 RepID=UPI0035E20A23
MFDKRMNTEFVAASFNRCWVRLRWIEVLADRANYRIDRTVKARKAANASRGMQRRMFQPLFRIVSIDTDRVVALRREIIAQNQTSRE